VVTSSRVSVRPSGARACPPQIERFDLHVHTCYSYDSLLPLKGLAEAVRRKGLDGLAVLDHDEIEGALRLRDLASFQVIVGEEIGSADGGIGALFIEERIPPHLSSEETIRRIRDQNGLVLIPHPLSRWVPGRIREAKLIEIVDQVDLIEGYNARAPWASDDERARQFAATHGIPVVAGSDGHFGYEIGRAWTELEAFTSPHEFLRSVADARLCFTSKTFVLLPLLTVLGIPALTLWRRMMGTLSSSTR
jgi:predicted metal-dependent phosphoesterase TrpH